MTAYKNEIRRYQTNPCISNARRLLNAYRKLQGTFLPSREDCDTIADARFTIEINK